MFFANIKYPKDKQFKGSSVKVDYIKYALIDKRVPMWELDRRVNTNKNRKIGNSSRRLDC